MSGHLHPAVRDVAATGAVGVAAGAAIMGVGAVVDSTGVVLLVAAVAVGVAALITPLRMPRAVREVLEELRPAPEAPIDEGIGRAVWWSVPVLAAGLGGA